MGKFGMTLCVAVALLMGTGFSYAIDALETEEGAKKLPVNVVCPMSGRAVNLDATSEHGDEVIGFCCNNCKGNFDDAPSEHIDKVVRLTVNTTCPMSGRALNPAQTLTHEGRTIGFCCADCKGNFESDPSEHISKVEYTPINKSCPMSERAVNPEAVSLYQGRVVAFCCNNCKGNFDDDPAEHIAKVKVDNRE